MRTSEQIDLIAAASAKAHGAMKPAVKDATNPAFRSKYADLSSIVDAMRGPCSSNGLAIWQDVTLTDEGIAVTTRLAHTSGQWVEFGPLTVPLAKRDAHGVGSATTYAKRYALSAALGIASDEDDDGNAAVATTVSRPTAVFDERGYADWIANLTASAPVCKGLDELTATIQQGSPAFQDRLRKDKAAWSTLKGLVPTKVSA